MTSIHNYMYYILHALFVNRKSGQKLTISTITYGYSGALLISAAIFL